MAAPAFQPNGAVTGIGSLPFIDVHHAVEFVMQEASIPFWPQLPRRSTEEQMLLQPFGVVPKILEARPDSHLLIVRGGKIKPFIDALRNSSAELSRKRAPGFFRLLQEVTSSGMRQKLLAVKGQSVGPVTALCSIRCGLEELHRLPECAEALVDFLIRQCRWQIEQLKGCSERVVIFLDEPMLGAAFPGSGESNPGFLSESLKCVVRALQQAGAIVGIHTCAPCQAEHLLSLSCDIISFDATPRFGRSGSGVLEELCSSSALPDYLERGGGLALGIVPTDESLVEFNVESSLRRINEQFDCAAKKLSPSCSALFERTLFTSSCGLGLLDDDRTNRSFSLAKELGARFAAAH